MHPVDAEALFRDWVAGSGTEAELEALCVEHEDHAAALRELHGEWLRVRSFLRRTGLGIAAEQGHSLALRLREQYGSGVDPAIALEGGEERESEPASSQLLKRLAEHSLKSSRYQLKGELARGGMGAILKVWDEDLRRSLAMKVILGETDGTTGGATPPVDRRLLARFLEEAQVTGQLDHPGIVPVHELGLDAEGRVYFTMKLVKGRDLKTIFELVFEGREGWNETRALGVILKVCEAMAYAHAKGVVHRDLKPANVMVGNFGEVYVMDWGLARVLGREDRHDLRLRTEGTNLTSVKTERREERSDAPDSPILTMDGDVVGTPAYMPPEQARGEVEKIGPHSDVYAIGAVLYHLLARQMPYVPFGARMSNRMVLLAVTQGPPEPLGSIRRDIPAELVAICDRAMAREPASRYRDTLELAEDLRAYLERRVVKAYRTGPLIELRKWVERNKGLAAASAAAALALVAGAVTSLGYASRAEEKSIEARREADRAEALARSEAEARKEAQASATEAGRLKDEAIVREAAATERADALWAIEELKHFKTLDDDLEYARKQDRPAYVWWLEQAHELVDGRPADGTRNLRRKPSLEDHRRLLERIRNDARPSTDAELAADRTSHPKAKELEAKRAELLWLSRMLGLEPWPDESEIEVILAKGDSTDAKDLNRQAWKLVDPDARVFGREIEAVELGRRVVQNAKTEDRAWCRDTLAWALLWAGRIDEALSEEKRAVEGVPPEKRAEFEGYLRRMESAAQPFRDGTASARRLALVGEVAALEEEVAERRTFSFDDREKEWWNTHLSELVRDLGELRGGIALAERSVTSPEAKALWSNAIEAIARSWEYSGLRLTPQLELLPLGPDPDSGLWEFAHLATGEPAVRGSDGKLRLERSTGIVFVLLPSGFVPVEEGKKPSPLNELQLEPFFLSKYEMTIAQWQRAQRTERLWMYGPLAPANAVSWDDCVATLEIAGLYLRLPTAAQWEYGCRAGTTTPWWTGAGEESLTGAANLDFDSGDTSRGVIKPVGQFRANPFGLHDVHGNVLEWCRDAPWGSVHSVEGEHEETGTLSRVMCGGSYDTAPSMARSGWHLAFDTDSRDNRNGLRVARGVMP